MLQVSTRNLQFDVRFRPPKPPLYILQTQAVYPCSEQSNSAIQIMVIWQARLRVFERALNLFNVGAGLRIPHSIAA